MWLKKLGAELHGGERGIADSLHLLKGLSPRAPYQPRPAQPLPPGAHDLAETYRVLMTEEPTQERKLKACSSFGVIRDAD